MYEFTMKGAWFRWSDLDAPSRWLGCGAFVVSLLGFLPIFAFSLEFGRFLGSDGKVGIEVFAPTASEACWIIGLQVLAGWLWWRFSMRQDELFNRIQNWSVSLASAWTVLLVSAAVVLDYANALPSVPAWSIVVLFSALFTGFWFYAVHRWAL